MGSVTVITSIGYHDGVSVFSGFIENNESSPTHGTLFAERIIFF